MFLRLYSPSTCLWIVAVAQSTSALRLPPLYTNASSIEIILSTTIGENQETHLTNIDTATTSNSPVVSPPTSLLSIPAGPASTSLTNHGAASDPIPSAAILDPPFTFTIPIPPGSGTPNALSVLLPALETFGTPVPTCWPCEWPTTVNTGAVSTGVPFTTTFTSLPPPQTSAATSDSPSTGNEDTSTTEIPSTASDQPTMTGATSISSEDSSITSIHSTSSEETTSISSSSQEPSETSSTSPTSFSTSTTTSTTSDTTTTESSTSSDESPTSMPSDFIPPAPPAAPSSASRCSEKLHWIAITLMVMFFFRTH